MKVKITVDDGDGGGAASGIDISGTTQPQVPAEAPEVSAGPAPSGPGDVAPATANTGAAVSGPAAGDGQPISAGPAPTET
jgi:hypothetical protein